MILLGALVVLLVSSFLPWYHVGIPSYSIGGQKIGGGSINANGWHQIGSFAWILVIIALVVEAARSFGALPLDAAKAALASAGIGALAALFVLIYVIVRLSDGGLGFGFWIGVVGLIGLVYGLFDLVKSGDVLNTAKSLQGNAPGNA
jgi:hypothetical protein